MYLKCRANATVELSFSSSSGFLFYLTIFDWHHLQFFFLCALLGYHVQAPRLNNPRALHIPDRRPVVSSSSHRPASTAYASLARISYAMRLGRSNRSLLQEYSGPPRRIAHSECACYTYTSALSHLCMPRCNVAAGSMTELPPLRSLSARLARRIPLANEWCYGILVAHFEHQQMVSNMRVCRGVETAHMQEELKD